MLCAGMKKAAARRRKPRYSEGSFREKVRKHARRAGGEVLGRALELYCCLRDKSTPTWARTVIVGALAYFIMPADAIPDWLAVAGFSDDLGALASAAITVAAHRKAGHAVEAREIAARWLGPDPFGQPGREPGTTGA